MKETTVNRRAFLGIVAGSLTAGLAPHRSARAQAGTPEVTGQEVRIGMSAAFRGTAAGLGTEFYRGAEAYYREVNARGGLFGRALKVVALDDGYEPLPCIQNTIRLVEREN